MTFSRITFSRIAVTALLPAVLLATALAIAACGVKGEPERPVPADRETTETED